jgi:hypothetical protein
MSLSHHRREMLLAGYPARPEEMDVPCPCCGDPMLPECVVCWTCYRLTKRLTPGTHADPINGHNFFVSANDIGRWDLARERRCHV